jgi:phenylalanyl-tRNA synthetase beta chain
MLVSWDWLSQYVLLNMPHQELADRLALSGLNHESTTFRDGEPVLDLEVTSNRGDCLSHLGVAREIAVLYDREVCIPEPQPTATGPAIAGQWRLENLWEEACPRYTARIVRGVCVGPSPSWLVKRLAACGIGTVNNIVDITNYVMLECGQPLHAFDLAKLQGGKIVVRPGRSGESMVAIDHKTYALNPSMLVIADAIQPVAIAGVMGGESSEVSSQTVDLLIEAADFAPRVVRTASRSLRLHSAASFRFERRIDRHRLDWASRRCCQLIQELAGGTLDAGMLDSAPDTATLPVVRLREPQIGRVLGIEIPKQKIERILSALGCRNLGSLDGDWQWQVPSWRSDLTREIDLIEELARIHGYERIPEDSIVPVFPSAKRPKDLMVERLRPLLAGCGFDEALTPSLVSKELDGMISAWTDAPSRSSRQPLLEGAQHLRRSLVPSLLQCWIGQADHIAGQVRLYEIASIYQVDGSRGDLPAEQWTLGLLGDTEDRILRGLIEELFVRAMGSPNRWEIDPWDHPSIEPATGLIYRMAGKQLAWQGQLSHRLRQKMKVARPLVLAEVHLDLLLENFQPVPTWQPTLPFPVVQRDFNLVVPESLPWAALEQTIRASAGPWLKAIHFHETYRDYAKDGNDRKRWFFSLDFQHPSQTLTGDQVRDAMKATLDQCAQQHQATLLSGSL